MWPFTSTKSARTASNRREFQPSADRLEAREVPATISPLFGHSTQVFTGFAGQAVALPAFSTATMSPSLATGRGTTFATPVATSVINFTPTTSTAFRNVQTPLGLALSRFGTTLAGLTGNNGLINTVSNAFGASSGLAFNNGLGGTTVNNAFGTALNGFGTTFNNSGFGSLLGRLTNSGFGTTLNNGFGTTMNSGFGTTLNSAFNNAFNSGFNNGVNSSFNSGFNNSFNGFGSVFNSGANSSSGLGTSAGTTLNSFGTTSGLAFNNGLGAGSFGTPSGFGAQSGLSFNNGLGSTQGFGSGLGLTF